MKNIINLIKNQIAGFFTGIAILFFSFLIILFLIKTNLLSIGNGGFNLIFIIPLSIVITPFILGVLFKLYLKFSNKKDNGIEQPISKLKLSLSHTASLFMLFSVILFLIFFLSIISIILG